MLHNDLTVKETKNLVARAALVLKLAEGRTPEGAAALLAMAQQCGEMLTALSVSVQAHTVLAAVVDELEVRCNGMQSAVGLSDKEIAGACAWPASNPRVWDDLALDLVVFEDEDDGDL